MKLKRIAFFAAPLIAMLALTGCPPKKKLPIDEKPAVEATDQDQANKDASDANPNDIQILQDWTEIPNLQIVRFNYDNAALDDVARTALKTNVAILKKLPQTVKVRVEGHTDERGTVEYNIALGQRRSNAVRSYYITSGIGKARIETISFGEERPVCTATTDECYAMNRRGVTKVRNAEAITVKPSALE